MPLTTISLALAFSAMSVTAPVTSPMMPQVQTVQEYVQSYFADEPIMVDIAQCESHDRQYGSDGSVYRGEQNHLDVGVMQINEHYHAATAKQLGLDLYTMQGNVAYARYLYQKEGTAPWASSEACWGKTADAKNLALASK